MGDLTLPASIGPPDTNTTGMFRAHGGHQHPRGDLSQFEMQTMASAQLTMYPTESAMSSRDGSEYSMPPWFHGDAVIDGDVEFLATPAASISL